VAGYWTHKTANTASGRRLHTSVGLYESQNEVVNLGQKKDAEKDEV